MIDENDLKEIPYGIADYNLLRESNYFYADKTQYIRNIEKKGRYLFFIRPRRFGKSLFLSTLESYYDIFYKDQFDYLFQGTYIHQNPTPSKNRFLVLKLNFSAVQANPSHVETSFLNYIQSTALKFVKKYGKSLDINVKEFKSEFNSKQSASDVITVLLNYCQGSEYKVYVIIDEYDNFSNTILTSCGEQAYRDITHGDGFLRSFFNVLKSGTSDSDAPISRLFMTGVSPITLDDVTSGFNIATNISLEPDLNEMLGFTREEVIEIIEYYRNAGKIHHTADELMSIMSPWYDNYRFSIDSDAHVFNTVQVLYFIQQYLFRSKITEELIDHNVRFDYNKLRHFIIIDKQGKPEINGNFSRLREIIQNGSIHSDIETGFPISKLTQPKNFVSLLYYFGLLTIGGVDDENTTILSIPNQSVKTLYYDYISETYDEIGILTLDTEKFKELSKGMSYRGQWKELIDYIAKRMEASLGLRDLMNSEKAHQVFWNVYLGMNSLYNVYSEKELNQGFCDLAMIPLLLQNPGIKYSYIIEIKYIKPSEFLPEDPKKIQALKEEAETQLNRYALDEKFVKSIETTQLKKLVLVFCGNRLVYCGEALTSSL